jgi:hypothetical protein
MNPAIAQIPEGDATRASALARLRDAVMDVLSTTPRILDHSAREIAVVDLGSDGIRTEARPTVKYDDLWPVLIDPRQKIAARTHAEGIRLAVPPETQLRILPATDAAANDE